MNAFERVDSADVTIRLVDAGWEREIATAAVSDPTELRIICPFIKVGVLDRLLSHGPKSVQVITRFSLVDFAQGVSDLAALRNLLRYGARVRGVRNLHAKLYLFGSGRAIVTSANLTEAAFNRNHEFGIVGHDTAIISACRTYFEKLWKGSGADLTASQIETWYESVARCCAEGARPDRLIGLGDFGADVGIASLPPIHLPLVAADVPQAFVKFLGSANRRVALSFPIIDEIKSAGCHWAVGYPASKRPTGVPDDAAIFIARLTHDPVDITVFGRAIGMEYVPGRDDATLADIEKRPWKKKYPRYIRVHHAEFVAGTMANGISLRALMRALGANSFATTKRNAALGEGNTNPGRAYLRQPAVELSADGFSWLNEQLQMAFARHGKVPQAALDELDWPTESHRKP